VGINRTLTHSELIGDESEKHFMWRIRQRAALSGWKWRWHQLDSIGTQSGMPDLILVRAPRIIFAELKSEHGRLSPAQKSAIADLEQCPGIETFVWRPSDWQTIVEVLA